MLENITAIAGLGLFVSGLTLLSAAMKSLVGKKLRKLLEHLSGSYYKKAVAGTVLGGVTQSTSASTFICMGLVNSGSLKFNNALTMLAWSSVGGSLLVFLASIDIRLVGLTLVALVGLSQLLSLDRHEQVKSFMAISFALGLLFFGLGMIKQGAHLLQGSYWVNEFVEFAAETGPICFILGLFFTLVTQSSSTITIIAIALVSANVIPFNAAVILVFGSNLGSGLSLILLSSHLNGVQKQISFFQFLTKLSGVIILMPVFFIFSGYFLPQSIGLVDKISIAQQISIVFLVLQIAGAISTSLFHSQITEVLIKIFPESEEESLFKLQFIYPEALDNPDIAIQLVRKEQDRLISSLTSYLNPLRGIEESFISIDTINKANIYLVNEIKLFIDEISHHESGREMTEVLNIQSRNESINSLLASLNSFSTTFNETTIAPGGLQRSMIESLHLILSLLEETIQTHDDYEFLVQLTSDKSQIMDMIRDSLISDSTQSASDKKSLYVSTRIFERIIWQIRQMIAEKTEAAQYLNQI